MGFFIFLYSSSLILNGVFGGDVDEVKSVSVTEGDSVTLHTDVIKQKDDVFVWCYGSDNSLVATTNGKVGSTKYYDGEDGKLIGRLRLDAHTGSLTITNMKTEESGLYTLKISNKKISYKKFNVNVNGVFADDVKSVSVMEGHSVTLHTDVIKQKDDVFVWCYGSDNSLVATTNGKVGSTKYYDGEDGKLIGRLMLDPHTGSLTITNMKTEESGLYTLKISNKNISYKKFNVNVNALLPVPVITKVSSECSSSSVSSCSVLCSVMNVSHDVSVSWFKGKSLLSSISVSDLNIRLSLPLEVEYQDTNTYRCVVNNPITNLTQHLNITQLCHTCADASEMRIIIIPVVSGLLFCVIVMIIIGVCIHRRAHDEVSLVKAIPAKVPLTDEERSSNSSDTSEYTEGTRFLHGHHHC
ncbi:natural killer cell receptor 2B4-like [Triplophysa dalaica]|uniref:natural killer cell receptor 2B4-like n=1 Tax=Triplophysa dalaica TaxID=1582913 RepID=UPI0024DFA254|nr:natural killer cell receptor 2B4-like [Triplophysa dalaica]XP_056614315.1 natural killer cell receptor 2B4-like [Triplophysa dalaica]